jgi:hypothetical protein
LDEIEEIMKPRHPFSKEVLAEMNAGRSFWSKLGDLAPWSERRRMRARREGRLFDCWHNDDPDWALKGGGVQSFVETIATITADGTQISNTTTETIVCPDFNIPAYYMAPGRTLRIWEFGVMSNVATTPGTLILALRWGGVAGTVLWQSAAQGLDTTARTNSLWAAFSHVVCRTEGATGTFLSGGIMWGNVLSSTAANLLPALLGSAGTPLASGSAAVTVDTTAAKLLSCTGKFSVATNPTNLTCHQRVIEAMN